uniref:CTD nuclear envelope phosphatase 1 n=1 Tax=Rhizophora mucronata TaxID=61149 RepID=A0A2P2MZ57_RHIMU
MKDSTCLNGFRCRESQHSRMKIVCNENHLPFFVPFTESFHSEAASCCRKHDLLYWNNMHTGGMDEW